MNDKKIISAISKIYFIITSFLLFIFLTLLVVFIILQNGLFIESISTQKFTFKQLYIKWNESLDISIKEIKIEKNKSQEESKFELTKISHELSKLSNYYNIFEKIAINKIFYDDIEASFKYARGKNGYINAHSNDFNLESSLFFESSLLNIKINKLQDAQRDINVSGNIILDVETNTAFAKLQVNIQGDIDLNIFLFSNEDKMFYKALSNKNIKSISSTISLLNLHPEVNYWADEAIRFSSISLKDVHGWIDFKDLGNAYKNIYAHALGKNLKYKYNKELDDIHTKKTDVIFKNGILYVYPRQAYTYKSKLGKSFVTVDFTKKEELLSIKLLFDAKLDKDTLNILKAYKIKVPFLQNTGITNVDLTIDVNLQTIGVSAKGKFFTKQANFNYLGHDIDVFDANIKLDNYDVTINDMLAKYNDIVTTKVDVHYNAQKAKGAIDFDISEIDFAGLSLDAQQSSLKAKYILSQEKDNIIIPSSVWSFKGHSIRVNPLNIPFDMKTLILNIPSTVIISPKIAKAKVYGSVDLNSMVYNFKALIEDVYFGTVSLVEDKQVILDIKYDKALSLQSNKRIFFKINELNSFINKPHIEIKDSLITMHESYINIDEMLKTKLSATYSLKTNKGEVKTNRLRIKTKTLGDLYMEAYDTNFEIHQEKESFIASSKDLKVDFLYNKNLWKLDLYSASRLAQNSKLLQKYAITQGDVTIYKKTNDTYTHIKSTVHSSNKVMVKNNVPIDKYFVNGKIDNKTNIISLNVNENIDVTIDKDVSVKIHDIGINMNALADIINAKQGNIDNYSSAKVDLQAINTYLYISQSRHILSEKIDLKYANKSLEAKLQYREGVADIKFKNGIFHIEGEGFNDEFMERIIALSKFKGGDFAFKMSGTPQMYDGIFTINNTTLLEYKILNNILAFVNTIPTLITFSTPSYSAHGLDIKTSYMKFNSKNNMLTISDLSLDSQELDILGSGIASFKNNFIDLELNLKTDLGSKVSKVPLVGYLLMDEDSISTTINVKGALDNPNVTSGIAKEIAVAPLNILLRAITLPYYLLNSIDSNSTQEEEEEE